jgi:hypothetical protein
LLLLTTSLGQISGASCDIKVRANKEAVSFLFRIPLPNLCTGREFQKQIRFGLGLLFSLFLSCSVEWSRIVFSLKVLGYAIHSY